MGSSSDDQVEKRRQDELCAEFILASFPRSANHWVRYIIEFLTRQPTLGEGNRNRDRKDPPIFKNLGMEDYYSSDQAVALKRHWVRDSDDRSKKLIFVIRDYREVIFRHAHRSFSIFKILQLDSKVRKYLDLIRHYEHWPSEKFLVCYEDLIGKPHETITAIAGFIGHEERLPDLLGDLEAHQQRCVGLYDKHRGSKTKGKTTSYHSEQYGDRWKSYLDWRIKKSYTDLMSKNSDKDQVV